MIALDAGAVIAAWDATDAHHESARMLFLSHARSVIHPVTLGEALVQAVRRDRELWARDEIAALGIRQLTLADDHPFELARARASTSLRMPDVCALVAAEARGLPLATFDRRLAEVARSRGVTVLP